MMTSVAERLRRDVASAKAKRFGVVSLLRDDAEALLRLVEAMEALTNAYDGLPDQAEHAALRREVRRAFSVVRRNG